MSAREQSATHMRMHTHTHTHTHAHITERGGGEGGGDLIFSDEVLDKLKIDHIIQRL